MSYVRALPMVATIVILIALTQVSHPLAIATLLLGLGVVGFAASQYLLTLSVIMLAGPWCEAKGAVVLAYISPTLFERPVLFGWVVPRYLDMPTFLVLVTIGYLAGHLIGKLFQHLPGRCTDAQ